MRRVSDRGRERALRLDRTRLAVRHRGGGRCEWPWCTMAGVDLAHAFGRGNVICAELADRPEFTWWACRQHHDIFDNRRKGGPDDYAAKDAIRWRAVVLMAHAVGFGEDVDRAVVGVDAAVDVARAIERHWKAEPSEEAHT